MRRRIDENEAIRLQWRNSMPMYRQWLQGLPETIYAELPKDRKGLQERLDLIRHYRLVDPATTENQKALFPGMEGQIQASLENIATKCAARSASLNLILTFIAAAASVAAIVIALISLRRN